MISNPAVKVIIIDGDGACFQEDLALPVGPGLARHKAPLPNALLLWASGAQAREDEVVCHHQDLVWCDC
jgi:hypothetical protein